MARSIQVRAGSRAGSPLERLERPLSRFLYLAGCAPLAAGLLLLLRSWLGDLTCAAPRVTRRERAALLLVVALGLVVVYAPFLLGSSLFAYRDAGLDTVDAYVPFYLDLLRSLREGTFGAWNFGFGLGASVVSYQSWLLDPFNLLLVPLGLALGDSCLGIALAIVQCAKVLAAGLLFDCLLTRYCETPLARVLGSACYAFSGFVVLWGQHYWLGGVSALLVLELLALERLAERGGAARFVAVAAVTALCVGWSPYCGFMVLLVSAVYMLLRLVHGAGERGVARQVLRGTLRLLAPVACGCLAACVTLVPYALYLFGETARVSSDASLLERAAAYATEFVPLGWLPLIASRLLGSALVTAGGEFPAEVAAATELFPFVNAYEFVALGFGPLCLVLLLQFGHWALTEATRRDRALVAVAAALVGLYLVNCFLPALLNIFSSPKYRSAFALAVPVCAAMAVGWERRVQARRVARGPLLAGAALSAAVVAWSAAHTVDGAALCAFYLLCVALGALLLLRGRDGRGGRAALLGACAVVAAGLLADALFVTSNRVACTWDDFPGAGDAHAAGTEEALVWVAAQDGSLYRVEKTYADWGLYNDALVEGYLGVNCYNSTGDGDVAAMFRALWPEAVGAAGASQNYLDASDPLGLTARLGVRYLLSREEQPEPFELVATFGDVNVYRNDEAWGMLVGRAGAVGESVVAAEATAEGRLALLDGLVAVPDEVAERLPSDAGPQTIEADLALEGGQVVSGTFEASADSVACLQVPYASGWTVLVDGAEVETFRANLGLIGFEVPAGAHRIVARYELPGLGAGAALGAAGVAATAVGAAAVAVSSRRRSRRGPSARR